MVRTPNVADLFSAGEFFLDFFAGKAGSKSAGEGGWSDDSVLN